MSKTSDLAHALLAMLEGEQLTAYPDSGGVLTIGIGHTGPDVHPGMTITPEQSQALFAQDQAKLLQMTAPFDPFTASAYISFGFNCGSGALSHVLAGTDSIANPKHTTDRTGKVLRGLVKRRALELALIAAAAPEQPPSTT